MIEQQPHAQPSVQQVRTIPIQEQSVRVGDVIVVNGYRARRSSLKGCFAEGGYHVHETQHFLSSQHRHRKVLLVRVLEK